MNKNLQNAFVVFKRNSFRLIATILFEMFNFSYNIGNFYITLNYEIRFLIMLVSQFLLTLNMKNKTFISFKILFTQ